jgi:hypothetical protein
VVRWEVGRVVWEVRRDVVGEREGTAGLPFGQFSAERVHVFLPEVADDLGSTLAVCASACSWWVVGGVPCRRRSNG